MLEITRSRTGQPTAILNGLHLHSPYDPVLEARRFVARATAGREPGTILLLGAGLGYLIAALRAAHPRARLLPVFYSSEISARCSHRPELAWDPESPSPLALFLHRQIAELDVEGLLVLEWPASARIYPRLSAEANREVRQLIQEHRGSLVTTMAAGRQWLVNGFINAVALESFLERNPRAAALPVVIAASGPTLERALPLLDAARRNFYLWALPSAVPCLISRGLLPDLTVVTDPSHFALYHLHTAAGSRLNLAMPLSAATGAWRFGCSVYPLCQGNFVETALLELTGLSAPVIPPRGTVAATAVELALRTGESSVILAGLDLCHLDLRSHARPNAFEAFLASRASRLNPLFSLLFTRSLDQAPETRREGTRTFRTSLALRTYSGHLAGLSSAGRLYRLFPSPVALEGMSGLDAAGLEELLSAHPRGAEVPQFLPLAAGRPRGARLSRALALLSAWEERLGAAAWPSLCADSMVLSLAYTIAPARLARAGRYERRGARAAAERAARKLLEDCRSFLQELGVRLRDGSADRDAA